MIKISKFISQFLTEHGVSDVFLVTGGGSLFLTDAFYDSQTIKYHSCHNEQAVTMAAEGYARAKKTIGVGVVTTGPGCTNAITGVAGAWVDSVPMLVLSGQVFLNQTIGQTGLRQYGIQEINIIDIVKPITKYSIMIDDPKMVKFHLQKAFYLAKSGRPGPVWLDIPANIQNGMIDPSDFVEFIPEEKVKTPIYEESFSSKLNEVISSLKNSKRPVVHIGQGIRISNAEEKFLKLVEKLGIPFVTSRNANDVCGSDHPLFVGRPGTFAQRAANFAVQNSDLYIMIGTRMSFSQTSYNSKDYARNAKKIYIDIDPAELNKPSLEIDLKIQADAGYFVDQLFETCKKSIFPQYDEWVSICREWIEKYPLFTEEHRNQVGSVSSYFLIENLSKLATPEDVIVTDMGFSFQCTHQSFQVKKGQIFFTNSGFAPMGWGLPAAIGACIATKRRTFCLTGDGGFMMNPQELAVVMHKQLPIKVLLFNNNGYLTIKQSQEAGFDNRILGANPESGVGFPHFQKIAEAHDIAYFKIENHKDLKEKLSQVLNTPGPVFCELIMDENEILGPRCVNRTLPDGKKVQTPIEDMYPFLEESEIRKNMSISEK